MNKLLIAAALGYLAGSFPSADIVTRLAGDRGRDLRALGTRNPGAWNAAKVLGPKWGALLLAVDIALGIAASALGRRIADDNGAYTGGAAAVIGHSAPVWRRFQGGKAVATSIGTKIVCFPVYVPLDLPLSATLLLISRGRAGATTYSASACFVAAAFLWWRKRKGNAWGPEPTLGLPLYAVVTSAVIAYRFLIEPPALLAGE